MHANGPLHPNPYFALFLMILLSHLFTICSHVQMVDTWTINLYETAVFPLTVWSSSVKWLISAVAFSSIKVNDYIIK